VIECRQPGINPPEKDWGPVMTDGESPVEILDPDIRKEASLPLGDTVQELVLESAMEASTN